MRKNEIIEIMDNVAKGARYKPGTSFAVVASGDNARIGATLVKQDVKTGKTISLLGHGDRPFSKLVGLNKKELQGQTMHGIRMLIHDGEMHEADEWLKFDGVDLFNPHRKENQNEQ